VYGAEVKESELELLLRIDVYLPRTPGGVAGELEESLRGGQC